MSRPTLKDTRNWTLRFESSKVTVEEADLNYQGHWYAGGAWKVVPAGGRPKYFYGESAWSNARRLAADLDFAAWSL